MVTGCHGSELRLPTFIDSHMVLQRSPQKARVWGWAGYNANVTARLDGTEIGFSIAQSFDRGWWIDFPPQPAGAGHTIDISDGNKTIHLEDIAFGDVYLCSGQSNMQMSVPAVFNATAEIIDSANYPNLRLATVEQTTTDTPQPDVDTKANYVWKRSGPDAVDGNAPFSYYSATCYFFGRDLYKSLGGLVPIGLLTSCWGGQKVEVFSSPDALNDETCGGTRPAKNKSPEESAQKNRLHGDATKSRADSSKLLRGLHYDPLDSQWTDGQDDPPHNSSLWNGMIFPFLPMRLSGVVWYQGEANSNDATSYACRFPAMISDWRAKFDLPDLPFVFVELAGFDDQTLWPVFRAGQEAALALPKVGMATAIDLRDPASPNGGIHPRRKQEVGRRVSLVMRSIKYKERNGLVYTGPKLNAVHIQTINSLKVVTLGFLPGTADGLHFHDTADCPDCCQTSLPSFQVMDQTGNWTTASKAKVIRDDEVILFTTSLVYGIRYGWEAAPKCILYNGLGGPDDHLGIAASPFEWCHSYSGNPAWTGNACAQN